LLPANGPITRQINLSFDTFARDSASFNHSP
jgi:hypothetical protein